MNNELKIFENKEFGQIRTVVVDSEPWFVGKDITNILGYSNPSKALADHVDEEDKLNNESLSSLGQRGGWLINESGLYSLILSSKMPNAKKFKRWVTSEVLPSIRKHGVYAVDEVLSNPDMLISALQELKAERAKRETLEMTVAVQKQQLAEQKPKLTYEDIVLKCKRPVTTTTVASDFGVTAKWLNQLLRERGIQYKHMGVWLLYPEYAKMGYTSTKTVNGKIRTYWTQKGRLFIRNVMKGQGIAPMIERGE